MSPRRDGHIRPAAAAGDHDAEVVLVAQRVPNDMRHRRAVQRAALAAHGWPARATGVLVATLAGSVPWFARPFADSWVTGIAVYLMVIGVLGALAPESIAAGVERLRVVPPLRGPEVVYEFSEHGVLTWTADRVYARSWIRFRQARETSGFFVLLPTRAWRPTTAVGLDKDRLTQPDELALRRLLARHGLLAA